jgi:hypothetical protein
MPGDHSTSSGPPTSSPPTEAKIAERVRALLAKAESTEHAAEAEAFTAGAQALMAKYAIDQLAVDAARGRPAGEVVSRRIDLDVAYASAKCSLLGAVGHANRCQVIWSSRTKTATIFGFEDDLSTVELLFTSLLTQATTAMLQASPPHAHGSKVRSFRHAFFIAYAGRIGQRLEEVAQAAVEAGEAEHGNDLLPALVRKEEAVARAVAEEFPDVRTKPVSISNGWGLQAGEAAAERADLGGTRLRGGPSGALSR